MKELWVEKYRPSTLKDYVVRDDAQRNQIAAWIKEGAVPHLLFSKWVASTASRQLFAGFLY